MSAKVLTIPPRAVLCELQEVNVLRSCNPLKEEVKTATTCQQTTDTTDQTEDAFKLSDIGVDLTDSIISEEQQEKAEAVFEKWQSVFSRGPLDLGHTDLIRHEIKLSDETPFKEPVRREFHQPCLMRFVNISLKCSRQGQSNLHRVLIHQM